ncbi:MAG: hypothetical protein K2X47_06285 [Bdellovibrionales bacterium]|nr:hypothetical protein [Bdellovibrionales bacterium]
MALAAASENARWPVFRKLLKVLQPELGDYWILLVYASTLGVLSLAVPVAVQSFVNTVAFGSLFQPVLVLAVFLLVVLGFSAGIQALNYFTLEILNRRLAARFIMRLAVQIPKLARSGSRPIDATNRFFELWYFQKVLTTIVLDGFGILLQTVVGLVLLAFYHPVFLAFDILLVIAIGLVLLPLASNGIRFAIQESDLKYEIGSWFQSIASNSAVFGTPQGLSYISEKANQLGNRLLDVREKAFFFPFLQNIGALSIFAIGSSLLLGIGGYLVMKEQLTLGQLVAAEIVVSSLLGGVAKFGSKLGAFYDLLASAKKIESLLGEGETAHEKSLVLPEGFFGSAVNISIDLSGVGPSLPPLKAQFSPGTWTQLSHLPQGVLELVGACLKGAADHRSAIEVDGISGALLPDGAWSSYVLDPSDSRIFDSSLKENLFLSQIPELKFANDVLESLGLLSLVKEAPQGIERQLYFDSGDLSESEKLKVALARCIFAKPPFLVLSDSFCQSLSAGSADLLLKVKKFCPETTVVAISGGPLLEGLFTQRVFLEAGKWKQI